MALRIGIIGIMHESNTFVAKTTTLADFRNDVLVTGHDVRKAMQGTAHEVGGFLDRIDELQHDIVPLMFARAVPSGRMTRKTCEQLVDMMNTSVDQAGPLDGLLCAMHGAAVGEEHHDFDGWWLSQLRKRCGHDMPIVSTCDPHANMTERMIENTDAIVAYRSNPHVDQHERGREAATLLHRRLTESVRLTQAWAGLPLAINIERQDTAESPCREMIEQVEQSMEDASALSASLILGFPFADVPEMGASVVACTDGDKEGAQTLVNQWAASLWNDREQTLGRFKIVEQALNEALSNHGRTCLLDMGDNIGAGSPGDGTAVLEVLVDRHVTNAFICICDPQVVVEAMGVGLGATQSFTIGAKVDGLHGKPVTVDAEVLKFTDGRFTEANTTHGGYARFNQGKTVVLQVKDGPMVMVTSRVCPPWSLAQLTHADLDPASFQILVAKGVNAPIAAYKKVCDCFIKVDTPGSTSANMERLPYQNRKRPMYPFDRDTTWEPGL